MTTADDHADAAGGGARARARARRRDPRPQLPGARGAGRRRLRRRLARALARGRRHRRRGDRRSAASTSWPRPRRSSRPEKTVLIPDLDAGCSLAASITAEQLRAWKAEHPGAVVVSYVNTTAEVKAESDYCCTSGNAKAVIEAIPPDQEILFLPDMYLGHLARAGHRPQADDLARRVPRPRRHPARRHRALAGRGARRRAARPPRVRLREPVHGVRQRAHAHPLDRGDDQLRQGVAEAAVPRRDRDRASSTACRRRRPSKRFEPVLREGGLQVHEDDHAREAARLAARLEVRGRRSSPRSPRGRAARSSGWSRSAEPIALRERNATVVAVQCREPVPHPVHELCVISPAKRHFLPSSPDQWTAESRDFFRDRFAVGFVRADLRAVRPGESRRLQILRSVRRAARG